MINLSKLLILLFSCTTFVHAQSIGTSIYTVAPKQVREGNFYVNYESGLGVRAIRPFGEDGVEQRVGVVYGLSRTWSIITVASGLVDNNSAVRFGSAAVELLSDILSQEKNIVNLSAGIGFLREYGGINVPRMRFAIGRNFSRWNLNSNVVLEKPLAERRDAFDVITTFSGAFRILPWLWSGIDAIGEDLEGFFEPEEAEGGAKLMIGPTIHAQLHDKMSLRFGGGPIYYLTQNAPTSYAPRLLPQKKSGYAVRLSMIYGF